MSVEKINNNLNALLKRVERQALDILEIEGKRSIRRNFESEGRPNKWQKKKRDDRRNILRGKTLRLFNEIGALKDPVKKAIVLSSALPYSKIHQEGGTIHRQPGKVRLRSTKSGQYRFAKKNSTRSVKTKEHKAYDIVIPARPFLVIPPMDFPGYINKLSRIKL